VATITLDGAYNARTLGSSPEAWIVRSAALDTLTAAGAAAISDLDLALVIDLREPSERGVVLHGIPVLHNPIFRAVDGPPQSGTLEQVYENLLLTRGAELTAAVAAIADADGPVLVHCTAGKDRTGLVVALALLAAGVSRDAVVSDYARSGSEVEPRRRHIAEAALAALELDPLGDIHASSMRLHLQSPAEALQHALGILDRFNGVENYLLRHGLTIEQFSVLRDRLGDATDES